MKTLKFAATVFAAGVAVASIVGIAPGHAKTGTTIKIDARTSPIYLLDTSEEGTGDFQKAVHTTAIATNCVPGEAYFLASWLTQDATRRESVWTGALGASEHFCPDNGRMTLGSSFAGDDLHPGKAFVEYYIHSCCEPDNIPEATGSRKVTIPRSH